MKKIFLTPLIVLMLSGCSAFRQPAVSLSSALDYSEYQKQGFFLSESNSVNFTYEPVASVSSLQLSGYKAKGSGQKSFNDDAYQTGRSVAYVSTSNEYLTASKSDVLKQLVQAAKDKGANAIINLEIKSIMGVSKTGYSYIQGYSSSGMAIKK